MLKNSCRLILLLILLSPVRLQATVLINEIMYDLPGRDDGREWIELFNFGLEQVNLEGWNIETTANHRPLTLLSGSFILPAGSFAVIVQDFEEFSKDRPGFSGNVFKSTFSLRNDSATIFLKEGERILDSVTYTSDWGAKGDGSSLQRFGNAWKASFPTPGEVNKIISSAEEKISPPALLRGVDEQNKSVDGNEKTADIEKGLEEEKRPVKEEEVLGVSVGQSLEDGGKEGSSIFKWSAILFGLFVIAVLPVIFSPRKDPLDSIKIIEE